MIWAVAWRNLWRNKLRSVVIIIAIAIGIFAGAFSWSFYRGMVEQRVQTAIRTESSHIQIHHPDYLVNPDQKNVISNMDSIAAVIDTIDEVEAVTARIIVNAMISSSATGSGVEVIGIDPEQERKVTNISAKIIEGSYFDGNLRSPVVIGERLASKLSVKLRSRIVLTMQEMNGELTRGSFRVAGIYKTSNTTFDEMKVFVKKQDLASLTGIQPREGHELAVMLKNNELTGTAAGKIRALLPQLDVKTWREIMPEVNIVEKSMDLSMYIFMVVILVALIFGIINTMLMAVLERIKELGMLMAVGMTKARVFIMILLETVFLSLTGGAIGIITGYFSTVITSRLGIDLTAFAAGYEKLGYEPVIYPVVNFDIDVKVAVMVLITGCLAALYPAWKAIHLNPAEALRIDV